MCLITINFTPSAPAATGTWTGTNNATWTNTASNWSGVSGTPWDSVNGLTNDAVFNTGGTPTAYIGGAVYARSLSFNSSAVLYDNGAGSALNLSGNSTISAASGQTGYLYTKILGSGTLTKSGSGDIRVFNQSGHNANTFSGAVVVDGGILRLHGGTSGRALPFASSYTINSGATIAMEGNDPMGTGSITINGGTLRHETGNNNFQSVGALTLNGGTVLSAQGAGASFQGLAFNGNVTVGGSAASTIGTQGGANSGVHLLFNSAAANRTFNVAEATGNAAADLVVSAPLLDSSHTGSAAGLIKTGLGSMQLEAANTYSGTTTVSQGDLVMVGTSANTAGFVVASGARLIGHSYGGLNRNITNSGSILFYNNHCAVGALTMNGGTLTTTIGVNSSYESVVLNGDVTIGGSSASSILAGGGSYDGIHLADTNSGGVVRTFNVADATGNSAADLTVSARLLDTRRDLASVPVGLAKTGSGTMLLTASNTYTGGTTISAGTLELGNGGSVTGNITNNATLSINRTDSSTLGNVVSGSGVLAKSGAGTAILSASNSYSGGTTLGAGTLRLDNANAAGTGTITQSDATSTLQINTTGTVSNAMSLYNLAALGTVTLSGAKTLNAASTVYDIAAGTTTIDSGALSGSGGLTKTGTGTLALGGASTYTGDTTVSTGVLLLANGSGLGSTTGGTTVASGAVLRLTNNISVGNEALTISGNGNNNQGGALRSVGGTNSWQGAITLAADARIGAASGSRLTLDVASGNAITSTNFNLSFEGAGDIVVNDAISLGTGGLIKTNSSGSLTLSASNSYSGETLIQSGRMILSGNGRLGSGAITVSNANVGTLEFAVTGTNLMGNAISGNGAILSSSGETRLTGAVTSTGGLTVSNSTVRIGNGGTAGSYSGNTVLSDASAQLGFDRSDDYTHSGAISGSGGVTKYGAGTTTLTASNTYTGSTTVNAGALKVASGGSISSSTTSVNSGGTLDVAGTAGNVQLNSGGTLKGSGTVSALTIASGGTLAPGNSPGTLTASSATWNGGGTYAWEINNFLGSAGSNWDFLNVTGGLTINASSGNKFIIDVISLLASNNTAGDASNFNAWSNYTFAIATAAGGISGFDSSYFNILTSNFSNNMLPSGATAAGSWSVSQAGNSINLNYAAAIPEPSSASLVLLGLGLAYLKRRRFGKS